MGQAHEALKLANAARLDGAAVKHELARGELTLLEAVRDPRARSVTVLAMLMAQRRWGRHRALTALSPLLIPENKRIGTLTARQRLQLGALEHTSSRKGRPSRPLL